MLLVYNCNKQTFFNGISCFFTYPHVQSSQMHCSFNGTRILAGSGFSFTVFTMLITLLSVTRLMLVMFSTSFCKNQSFRARSIIQFCSSLTTSLMSMMSSLMKVLLTRSTESMDLTIFFWVSLFTTSIVDSCSVVNF